MIENVFDDILFIHCPEDKHPEEWDMKSLKDALYGQFSIYPDPDFENFDDLRAKLMDIINRAYENKEREIGTETFRYLEKMVLLQVLDVQYRVAVHRLLLNLFCSKPRTRVCGSACSPVMKGPCSPSP